MSIITGLVCGHHDESVALLDKGIVSYHGSIDNMPSTDSDIIAYYQRPLIVQTRRLFSGEGVDLDRLTVKSIVHERLNRKYKHYYAFNHHLCHAAAFQQTDWDNAICLVIDAIGEWDTVSIWSASYIKNQVDYQLIKRWVYPDSVGLLYSALAQRAGFEPMKQEHDFMKLSIQGNKQWSHYIRDLYLDTDHVFKLKTNLHRGVQDNIIIDDISKQDLAANAQQLLEDILYRILDHASSMISLDRLVYSGGVAYNTLANQRVLGKFYNNVYIPKHPGDYGSSIGAASLQYKRRLCVQNS